MARKTKASTGKWTPAQQKAHDRIVASAPDLLQQLINLRNEYIQLANSIDLCGHDWGGMYNVDEVIANATGRHPDRLDD